MPNETLGNSPDIQDVESLMNDASGIFDSEELANLVNGASDEAVSEPTDDTGSEPEQGNQKKVESDGALTLADVAAKKLSWEELSAMKDKLPPELKGAISSMERAVQMKFQTVAEERKEAKRIREEVDALKAKMLEEPPYIRAERERREQEALRAKLDDMTPEERLQYEMDRKTSAAEQKYAELQKQFEFERLMAFKSQMLSEIKFELLSNNMPAKEAQGVYDIFVKHAAQDGEYTVADAVNEYKEKAVSSTPVDLEAIKKQAIDEYIAKLRAKQPKANGIRTSSGSKVPQGSSEAPKRLTTAGDIWNVDDLERMLNHKGE